MNDNTVTMNAGKLSPQKIVWVLSLSHLSALSHAYDLEVVDQYASLYEEAHALDALDMAVLCPKQCDAYVQHFLKLRNSESYYNVIEQLMTGDTALNRRVNADFINAALGQGGNSDLEKFVAANHLFWRRNGYRAYELSNAIVAVRLAGAGGTFTREEVLTYLDRIGTLIETSYRDYESFARLCALSHRYTQVAPAFSSCAAGMNKEVLKPAIFKYTLWQAIPWGGNDN